MIIDKIKGEKEVKEFFFPKDLNHFCAGCYKCIENVEACPYYKEKEIILNALDEADIIVVTTPTYCMNMSAPLKAFFDLTFDLWMVHRPMKSMFTKRAVIVSSAAGPTTKHTLKAVKNCLFYFGVPKIYKYGKAVQAMNFESVNDKIKNELDKKTTKISKKLSTNKKPKVGLKTKFMFKIMGMLHKKGWDSSPVEGEYWKNNGWFDGKKPWKE